MKHISITIVLALTLALLAYAHSPTPKAKSETYSAPGTQTSSSTDKMMTTQNRLNSYFRNSVMPSLKTCWDRIQGEGDITIKSTYTKGGTGWVWNRQQVISSTLPTGQDAVASKCMQDTIRSTSFPLGEGESASKEFAVYWTWPVPLPANDSEASAMYAARKKGGTGGCDGHGAPAKCKNCSGGRCQTVCVGYDTCTEHSNGDCSATTPSCASGGPYGVFGGGMVVY